MSKKISGRTIASEIKENLKKVISQSDQQMELTIVYVGRDPVIDNFISYKEKFAKEIGVETSVIAIDGDIAESDLVARVKSIVEKGAPMIIQLPLPEHIHTQRILDLVPLGQDVDLLSTSSKEVFSKSETEMLPPVAGALIISLLQTDVSLEKAKFALFGFGDLVGKPFAAWLEMGGYHYDVIDRETSSVQRDQILMSADVIVAGAGVPGAIAAKQVKKDVILLDAGTSEVGKKILGDVHPEAYEKASYYTPVPGGIGPVTIAVLYQNLLVHYLQLKEKNDK